MGLAELISQAGYPATRELSAWQSAGTLLLAKCARKPRVSHAGTLADDEGLAFTLGLTALPKTTHLGTYSWRVRREASQKPLTGLIQALRPLGLATGQAGFNCDFHAIRHHGDQAVLEKHYVLRRSQRTRAVLTFFAQDHATSDMVYANADITKAEQAAEIIAFADYWNDATGADPGLLVFDLNNTAAKPLTLIPKVRAKLKKSVSVIGFLSHLQGDLKMKATEAGCDTVMPRSAFSQSLPNLIMRYGLNEEEDNHPQPM